MLLKEYLQGKAIFNDLEDYYMYNYFGNVAMLNTMLTTQYGERKMFNKLTELPYDEVIKMLSENYKERWKWAKNFSRDVKEGTITFNLLGDVKTLTEKITINENKLNDRNDVNKVSGFDSSDLVVNDGATSENKDVLDGTKNRILTTENIDYRDLYKGLSLLQKNTIITLVLKDVSTFLTLDIY